MSDNQFNFKQYLTEHPELYTHYDLANKTESEWIQLLKAHHDANVEPDCGMIGPTGPAGPIGPTGPIGQEGPAGENGIVDFNFVPIYTSSNNLVVDLRDNSNINYAVYAPALGNKDLNIDILHDDTCIGKKGNILIAHWDEIDLSRVQTVPDIMIEKENRFLCIGPSGRVDFCYEIGSDLIENKGDSDEANDIECVVFQNDLKTAINGGNSRKVPVYNYDFVSVPNQSVTYNSGTIKFYLDSTSVLENLENKGERWFFKHSVTENVKPSDLTSTFSITNQWYYLDEETLKSYVQSYINQHKNDLSYLSHSATDSAFVGSTADTIFCVPIEDNESQNYRKIRLNNINIPLKAFERLSQEIDSNSSYSGNVDIVLKGTVDFKITVTATSTIVEILQIGAVLDKSPSVPSSPPVTWKKYTLLKAYKKNCPLWSFYDMAGNPSSRNLEFTKHLALDKTLTTDASGMTTQKWNKVLDVVVRPITGLSTIKNMQKVNVYENGNNLVAKKTVGAASVNETQVGLYTVKPDGVTTDSNSVSMTHYTYSVDMYNTVGDTNTQCPRFIARMNRFVGKKSNVLSVKLGSVLRCVKEAGNNKS